jgi:hypothetical protein
MFVERIRQALLERRLARLRSEEHRETLSHHEVIEQLGYMPDSARIRIRRAQPPKTPVPK